MISISSYEVCEVAMYGERLEEPLGPNARLPWAAVVSCDTQIARSTATHRLNTDTQDS
jgi:hypothetical protein